MASFFGELRRRNVFKVAVAYAIVAWLVIQIADTTFPILQIPDWAVAFVTMLLLLGFPVALILSWAYELTPDGLARTKAVPASSSITQSTGQKINVAIIVFLLLAVMFMVVNHYVLEESVAPVANTDDRRSRRPSRSNPTIVRSASRDVSATFSRNVSSEARARYWMFFWETGNRPEATKDSSSVRWASTAPGGRATNTLTLERFHSG